MYGYVSNSFTADMKIYYTLQVAFSRLHAICCVNIELKQANFYGILFNFVVSLRGEVRYPFTSIWLHKKKQNFLTMKN